MKFSGYAIYADGDMVCNADITELWNLRDPNKAVQVVKHDYLTKMSEKYLGNKNENYPKKNWSSLILWNCATPEFIGGSTGAFLHRFEWLADSEIGEIPIDWNWLATEYEINSKAKLIHYTLGTPCFSEYRESDYAEVWHEAFNRTIQGLDR